MSNIIYFELNNWLPVVDYPNEDPYISWLEDDSNIAFLNQQWVEENKLCVVWHIVDQSIDFLITATQKWVEKNCPTLLTEYTEFLRSPDDNGAIYGRFADIQFLLYKEENIGVHYAETKPYKEEDIGAYYATDRICCGEKPWALDCGPAGSEMDVGKLKEDILNAITAKINEYIAELNENAKNHADFIQENTDMVVYGLETALDIVKEVLVEH